MCCIQTQTKAAAIICCILTGIYIVIDHETSKEKSNGRWWYHQRFQVGEYARLETRIPGYVFCIVSDVMCLIGAYKYKKYLFLPFIVKTGLFILGLVSYLIFLIHFGINRFDMDHLLWIWIITYFLVSVFKVFQEISAVTSGRRERIVLQPISSQPIARNTEVGNNHLHSGDQNQTYGYQ